MYPFGASKYPTKTHFRSLVDNSSNDGLQSCAYTTHPNTFDDKPFLKLRVENSFSRVSMGLFILSVLVGSLLIRWIIVITAKPHKVFETHACSMSVLPLSWMSPIFRSARPFC